MSEPTKPSNMNNEQEARRKLLKMATYVPPAILGVMIAGNKIAEAGTNPGQNKVCDGGGTIIVSANGNACCPCVPGPDFDANKCAWKKCKLGNCAACPPGPYNGGQCNKVASACACACTNPGKAAAGGDNNKTAQNGWVCN
ncbi:MAG: hypothetical protein R8K22_03700 [Mariprofundaceae bacterium]